MEQMQGEVDCLLAQLPLAAAGNLRGNAPTASAGTLSTSCRRPDWEEQPAACSTSCCRPAASCAPRKSRSASCCLSPRRRTPAAGRRSLRLPGRLMSLPSWCPAERAAASGLARCSLRWDTDATARRDSSATAAVPQSPSGSVSCPGPWRSLASLRLPLAAAAVSRWQPAVSGSPAAVLRQIRGCRQEASGRTGEPSGRRAPAGRAGRPRQATAQQQPAVARLHGARESVRQLAV